MSARPSPADAPLVSWSDVVFTLRDSGQDRILLGAADLAVYAGETVCIAAADDATRRVVVDLLTGRARPHYGVIKGTGHRLPRQDGAVSEMVAALVELATRALELLRTRPDATSRSSDFI